MSIFEQAMGSAMSCPKDHDLQIGDKVTVLHRDYQGETGTIVKEETNLLGLPLVILDMLTDETRETCSGYELSFYPHEVKKIEVEND